MVARGINRTDMPAYHVPVLLDVAVDGLNINSCSRYVDATYGGGGHAAAILKKLTTGNLYAFDQDADAVKNVENQEKLVFVAVNFRYMKNHLKMIDALPVNGVLADLGVSSHQFDTAERGFSIRYDGPLDMRMDKTNPITALEILNTYTEQQLIKIFFEYGELSNSRAIAGRIISLRPKITTTQELKIALIDLFPKNKANSCMARVFQALRIEVNDEMAALKTFLTQCEDVLAPKGRLVVISYHSLEDRMVKNFMKKGKFNGEVEKDFYGNDIRPFKPINNKPIIPNEKELAMNPRARSAKLRIAERLKG